eukprot:gene9231-14402_t
MPYYGAEHAGYSTGKAGELTSDVDASQDLRFTRGTQPQAKLPNQFFTNQWVDDGLWQPTSFG